MDGYSIGQVAKILRMPHQTLRFLEEKGLVNPTRDRYNDYRRYSLNDVAHLIDYRWYRDAGYSLQDSIDTIVHKDLFQSVQKMKEMQQKATIEAKRQELIARRLANYTTKLSIDYLSAHIGVHTIERSPGIYWCINAVETPNNIEYKPASQLEEWFSMMLENYCFVSHMFCIFAESLQNTRMDYGITWGYGIEEGWACELGLKPRLDMLGEVAFIPPAKSIHFIMRIESGSSPTDVMRETTVSYLESEGLSLAGDVWGNELITVGENGVDASYVELWAPIGAAD